MGQQHKLGNLLLIEISMTMRFDLGESVILAMFTKASLGDFLLDIAYPLADIKHFGGDTLVEAGGNR